jgi:hypothetical protein
MKTRKTVIAVLITALVISAALIVGCMDQFDGISVKDAEDNYQIPEGKGIVKLKINGTNARTIVPSLSSLPIEDMWFTITCTPGTGSATVWPAGGGRAQITGGIQAVVLANETYSIIVSAFDDYDSGDSTVGVPVAGGSTSGVTVNNNSEPAIVNLIGITNGTNDGTFFYNISPVAPTNGSLTTINYSSKKLQIWTYDAVPAQVGGDIFLGTPSGSPTGDKTLKSGFYTVKVILEANNCDPMIVDEILHIYPSMTSYYGTTETAKSVPAPVQNLFKVNYSLDGKVNNNTLTLTENVSNAGTATSPGTPTNDDYTFVKWVTAQGGTTAWNFSVNKIFKDTTIWAEWVAKAGANITITFTISDLGNISDLSDLNVTGSGKVAYTYADILAKAQQLKFKTTLYDAVWKLNGTILDADTTTIADDTLIIDGGDGLSTNNCTILDKLASGTHRITVSGKVGSSSGAPYSAYIEFTINNN